jgi:neural cell adhesion molecule
MVCWELFLGFVVALTAVCAQTHPSLEIQPNNGGVNSVQIGASIALTCKPNVDDPKLISQLEWRDPINRRIENTNRANPIYVQSIGDDPGLVLIFQRITTNHAGNYTCAANYASEELRATVMVRTYLDITFVDAPESQFPRAGRDYLVKCKVQGDPTPIVDWNKDGGSMIVTSDRYVVQNEGLLIKNVKESDDGVYKCTAVVVSTGQIKVKNIKVEVIIPPEIEQMTKVSVIEGETAWTKCVATGKPPPTYTWIKQGTSQDLSKTDRFDVKKNTGDLIITRVEFNDDDIYKCIAENQAGRVESTVKIDVMVKPKIYELLNVTAPVNSDTKIMCKAKGRPKPNITFRKLSIKEPLRIGQQPHDRRIILEQQCIDTKGECFGILDITKLNRSDDGLYECIAENSAGTSYKNGHITVEFPPTFERTKALHKIAWAWNNHPGNLTCIPEAIPNATIIWKFNNRPITPDMLRFKQEGNGPISHLIVNSGTEHTFFTKYECVATNKLGSDSIWVELKEARVPEVITQIKAQSITATTIKFDIQPPPYFDTLPIRSFTVRYRGERYMGQNWELSANHTWSYRAPYILENLIPETTYQFQFAAKNDVGYGPWRNAPQITMPRRSEPAEPKIHVPSHSIPDDNSSNRQDVIAVSPYADHFELRWQVPNDNGDPIDYYLIRYCMVQKVNGEWRDNECSEEIKQSVQYASYELNKLKPDTVYKIELRAHNTIGSSSPAQIRVKTARGEHREYYSYDTYSSGTVRVASAGLFPLFVSISRILFS